MPLPSLFGPEYERNTVDGQLRWAGCFEARQIRMSYQVANVRGCEVRKPMFEAREGYCEFEAERSSALISGEGIECRRHRRRHGREYHSVGCKFVSLSMNSASHEFRICYN